MLQIRLDVWRSGEIPFPIRSWFELNEFKPVPPYKTLRVPVLIISADVPVPSIISLVKIEPPILISKHAILPLTSNKLRGLVVPIPTLPLLKVILEELFW